MESLLLRHHFSRNVILRMFLFAAIGAGVLFWKMEFISEVYFRHQLTQTGLIINGTIVGLFLLGLLRIFISLITYSREESAIRRFMQNLDSNLEPIQDIPAGRIIVHRYKTLETLHKSNTPINHGALATTLVASESTSNSLPKFINNILILTGVFGTIVSLSIALTGASDLLATSINVDGMGLVVHGMSTALSTTITAIICYLYFGYFYMKLTDVQTNMVSAIEQITATHLIPRFQVQTESVLFEFTGMIRSLQSLISRMENSQQSIKELAEEMRDSQSSFEDFETRMTSSLMKVYDSRIDPILVGEMEDIKLLLKHGFRLTEES